MNRPSSVVIRMEDDYNELGLPRKREAESYPRKYATLVFPLAWPYTAQISVPERMSAQEFDTLMDCLRLARGGLVR